MALTKQPRRLAELLGKAPCYLDTVQLLRQDPQEVLGEAAQQWGVPVPVVSLTRRGSTALQVNAGGKEVTVRKELRQGVPGARILLWTMLLLPDPRA